MIVLSKENNTQVFFYSNLLEKNNFYSGGKYEIVSLYDQEILVTSQVTLSNRGFRHAFTINARAIEDLVDNRRFELIIYNNDEIVFRDNAIVTDQDISQTDQDNFSWNADKYTYLTRVESNKYKTLTR